MSEGMSLCVNGQSKVPPGFRFHPTEEELLEYYLRKKVAYETIDFDVIREIDLNKLEPWEIQENCRVGSCPQSEWYFFSHKDKKYPTGKRTNRATVAGFWKATGRDKVINSNLSRIGMRKTLVFYTGRAPHGQKSDWIMHEYRLEHGGLTNTTSDSVEEDGWVVCRAFRKKIYQKSLGCFKSSNYSSSLGTRNMHAPIDQILSSMRENSVENNTFTTLISSHATNSSIENIALDGFSDKFIMLLNAGSADLPNLSSGFDHPYVEDSNFTDSQEIQYAFSRQTSAITYQPTAEGRAINNGVTFDRLAASQLNGLPEAEDDSDFLVTSEESPTRVPRKGNGAGTQSTFYHSSSSSSSDPIFHFCS